MKIDATTTGEGTTWGILRKGHDPEGEYSSPEEALAALEKEISEGEKRLRYVQCKICGKPHAIPESSEPQWSSNHTSASLQVPVAVAVPCPDHAGEMAVYSPSEYISATEEEWRQRIEE